MTRRWERGPVTGAERERLVREGEAFAAALARVSYYAEDLEAWIRRAENDIERARLRAGDGDGWARRELVYKPVLLERLREISRARVAAGRSKPDRPRPEGYSR